MILPARGESVDTEKRNQIRKRLKPQVVIDGIESLTEIGQMRLTQLFTDDEVHEVCDTLGMSYRKRAFSPAKTLGLFIAQVLSRDESCSTTVSRFNKARKEEGLQPVSGDASAYCKARSRLPIALINCVSERACIVASEKALTEWKMFGRNVYLVDGFTLRAPDTAGNQERYPQSSSQEPGLGFPQIRLVVATSLATGCITAHNSAPCTGKKNGEASLFREFLENFAVGDIIVGDCNFESYHDFSLLRERALDGVFCINGTRKSPFQDVCECVDQTYKTIERPKFDSNRFTREQWETLPESQEIRFIQYRTKGRSDIITIVTTLLDANLYPAKDVAILYGLRWDVEIDLGCLKTTMGQGELRCLIPDNIDREIAVTILAYNLVRVLMNDAAQITLLHPREISFSHARDSWITFGNQRNTAYDLMWLILSVTSRFVRDRPGRQEPRAVKRRKAKYSRLKKPRQSYQREAAPSGPPAPPGGTTEHLAA